MIKELMLQERFHFVRDEDKQFICEFTENLEARGYTFGGAIGSGFCWGKYMLVYTKANVKSKKVVARIYIREKDIVLRLFLNEVSKHAVHIANSPGFIRDVFVGEYGKCKDCKGDTCKLRKEYIINETQYKKCNGFTFEFNDPNRSKLSEYTRLFDEFFPTRKVLNQDK